MKRAKRHKLSSGVTGGLFTLICTCVLVPMSLLVDEIKLALLLFPVHFANCGDTPFMQLAAKRNPDGAVSSTLMLSCPSTPAGKENLSCKAMSAPGVLISGSSSKGIRPTNEKPMNAPSLVFFASKVRPTHG